MKHKFFIFLLIILYLTLSFENELVEDYPFSIRLGYNEAITFLSSMKVALFNVKNMTNPLGPITYYGLGSEACDTTEEKGGIYLDGYIYLSCLDSLVSKNAFSIKIYKRTIELEVLNL